jgi:hypothetical protein
MNGRAGLPMQPLVARALREATDPGQIPIPHRHEALLRVAPRHGSAGQRHLLSARATRPSSRKGSPKARLRRNGGALRESRPSLLARREAGAPHGARRCAEGDRVASFARRANGDPRRGRDDARRSGRSGVPALGFGRGRSAALRTVRTSVAALAVAAQPVGASADANTKRGTISRSLALVVFSGSTIRRREREFSAPARMEPVAPRERSGVQCAVTGSGQIGRGRREPDTRDTTSTRRGTAARGAGGVFASDRSGGTHAPTWIGGVSGRVWIAEVSGGEYPRVHQLDVRLTRG